MQDDCAGGAMQRIDDPSVRRRVVAHVVHGEVAAARRALRAPLHDLDLGALAQSREEKRGVVRDARALGRDRREERDLHARSLAIARSQVTSSASALPRRPIAEASSTWSRSHATASATARGSGDDDEPRLTIADDVEWPTRIGCCDHRLLREEALVRPHPEVLVDRRVVDRAAACVEVGETLWAHPPFEAHAAVEATVADDPLEPRSVGPVADDHHLETGVERRRLDQHVEALGTVESARREDEPFGGLAAVRELLRPGAAGSRRRGRSSARGGRRRCLRWQRVASPRRARSGRAPAPCDGSRGPPASRRTGRGRCRRARRPGETGARATRASRGDGRHRTGTSSR